MTKRQVIGLAIYFWPLLTALALALFGAPWPAYLPGLALQLLWSAWLANKGKQRKAGR